MMHYPVVIGIAQLPVRFEQAHAIASIAKEQTRFTAEKDHPFARLHHNRRKSVWIGSDIDFIVQAVAAEIYIHHAMVEEFDILIPYIDNAIAVPIVAGTRHELIDRYQWWWW